MLAKKNRLISGKTIDLIKKKGSLVKNKNFYLNYLKNNNRQLRFALIVSLKISQKAVVRNKIRRQMYSAIKQYLTALKPEFDCVLMVNRTVLDMNFTELSLSLKNIFQKAGLL